MIKRRCLAFCFPGIWMAAIAADGQIPRTIVLAPVGLAATETAQINIVSSAAAYPGGAFVTTCQASVTFYGADGTALGAATDLTAGNTAQVLSAKLPYAATGATGARTAISARIALTPAPAVSSTLAPPIPPCALAYSLETYDTATGVTHAYVSGEAAQSAIAASARGSGPGSPR